MDHHSLFFHDQYCTIKLWEHHECSTHFVSTRISFLKKHHKSSGYVVSNEPKNVGRARDDILAPGAKYLLSDIKRCVYARAQYT